MDALCRLLGSKEAHHPESIPTALYYGAISETLAGLDLYLFGHLQGILPVFDLCQQI